MSLLTIHYGQCGNQIGDVLFSTVFEDLKRQPYHYNSYNKWFNICPNGKLEARSILIDTETKVVDSRKRTQYDFKNIITGHGGSANNWAFGYNFQSKMMINSILEKVRVEIEKSDYSVRFLNILSSSGGTGSGVGSKVIEKLRSAHPNKTIMNVIVLPYMNGELVTQHYNSVLSLAKLHGVSDMSIIFENDLVHDLCPTKIRENINFLDMNKVIALQLASTFQPITAINNAVFLSRLSSHPVFKYVHLRTSSSDSEYSNQPWKNVSNSLMKGLTKWKTYANSLNMKKKTIIVAAITRGTNEPRSDELDTLQSNRNFVSWIPANEHFIHNHETRRFCGSDKTLTVISNDNSVCYSLNSILEDAWRLFSKKAYLHHYEKHGVDKNEFLGAFQMMENILASYIHM
ncbi:hypothetical protein HHI36_012373 [Cryptolaemus montrouzieri]|uniref:Tubulin/FtsZ GTPase domain-containing protein n=1 Tax=Cryptolaemus montrouzieri TaxID=559131 RepID=A0ABD2NE27_9CUCU